VLRPRMVLVAIAEAADDFGFACLSIETIAKKAVCDPRTAMRMVHCLEVEGWVWVNRRAVGGKASVYFVNIARLGVVLNPKFRKNQWHLDFERKFPGMGATRELVEKESPVVDPKPMEPPPSYEASGSSSRDIFTFRAQDSGDICGEGKVTFDVESGDISPLPIRKNRVNRENRKDAGTKRGSSPNPNPNPDPRHVAFKMACETYARFKGVTFIWDGSEARALSLLLKSAPQLALRDFQQCLNHRARSPGVPHGERPRLWLQTITRYQQGPLNRFHQTEEDNGKDFGNRKANAAHAALARAQARIIAQDRADEETGFDVSGSGRGNGRYPSGELLEGA
jgi:hypothetical protein